MHSSQKRSTFAALNHLNNDSMEMNKVFKDGLWSKEINVSDLVYTNITPYEGDASFLAGFFYDLDTTVRFDGTAQKFVRLKTYNQFVFTVNVSCFM